MIDSMANIVLPPCWRPGRSGVPAAWFAFADETAQILAFLTSSLQGVYVASQRDGTPSLLYAYTVGGDLCLYHGRPRLETVPRRFASIWHQLPAPLRQFYETLHNGWTFQPANSMGPLPVEDWAFLSEDRFDIDAITARAMSVDSGRVLAVFHNGAGDYLCLHFPDDAGQPASGMIWWHEQPDELEPVDFMATLDAWVGLFVDEADRKG